MPWYFYGKGGVQITPIPLGVISTGAIVPSVLPYTSTPPEGYLFCAGQSVLKNDYLDLFAEIGTAFGTLDINHFTLPDMRTRMPRGIISSAQGVGSILGVGGSKTHTHSIPSHTHSMVSTHTHTMPSHYHTFSTHGHVLGSHGHDSGSLVTGATNSTRITDTVDGADVGHYTEQNAVEDQPQLHHHAVYGAAGGVNDINPNGAGSTLSGGSNAGASTADSLDSTALNGTSDPAGAATSTPIVQYPPYYTTSFLIKI